MIYYLWMNIAVNLLFKIYLHYDAQVAIFFLYQNVVYNEFLYSRLDGHAKN